MNHTDIPWRVEERHPVCQDGSRVRYYVTASDDLASVICAIQQHEDAIPNAERIVACVNACGALTEPGATIPALVAALQAIVASCTHDDGSISPEPKSRGEWLEAMVDARAALALVQP